MPLIRGDRLSPDVRAEVLAAYIHRGTHENRASYYYQGACPLCWAYCNAHQRGGLTRDGIDPAWHSRHAPLISDAAWLAAHAFHVTRRGKLYRRRPWAEPASFAESAVMP